MNADEESCSEESDFDYETRELCPPYHDTVLCWPATLANTTAYQYCKGTTQSQAYRHCLSNGDWDEIANYSSCFDDFDWSTLSVNETATWNEESHRHARILMMIMFVGGIISLVVLTVSLAILYRFKSLQCERTSIHKNMIASFILRFLIVVIMLEPYFFGRRPWYESAQWMCRSLITIEQLSYVANFCWMLVEGLYLHIILVMRPLNSEKVPFIMFYIIGWVIPLVVAVAWATVMHFEHPVPCWRGNTRSLYIYIIYTPILFTLFINLLILMNLVRIIVLKLCTGHAAEQRRICRTIKSTIVLVFLLGVINVVLITSGNGSIQMTRVYRYVNSILPNCQGIVVSVYCSINTKVRRAIRNRWNRFVDSRSLHGSAYRGRNSRTSMSTFISRGPQQCHDTELHALELQALNDVKTNGNNNAIRRHSNM